MGRMPEAMSPGRQVFCMFLGLLCVAIALAFGYEAFTDGQLQSRGAVFAFGLAVAFMGLALMATAVQDQRERKRRARTKLSRLQLIEGLRGKRKGP
jgi:hypothetical protein